MSPSARLRQHAAALIALADELDAQPGAVTMVATAKAVPPDEWIDIAKAERITKMSRPTLRRWARKFGCGEQTDTKQFRFRRSALLAVALCRGQHDANVPNDAASRIPMTREPAHISETEDANV